ncbi:RecX family transcriptional regulator [Reichenbachiella carrageenanivorans]|uniref:Regulatory protein RecX n=1 Tax=Reichenbachiella carrageenanivorans TaxID=2979869 RepID=A0ABY6D459_9BACT|nr:RecX family transcriptional regulator [Reichenbachiella carrageenanivorans]UXX80931.1 RecX family transcriptional regulator [Reichenbachiella carrageenanivorans]
MEEQKKTKRHTPKEAKLKAANFCAYQERSQKEVRNKLYELGLYPDEVEDVLTDLITDNFVNEERFAKAYVGGKFRVKKWGRKKIMIGLAPHKLSTYCIKKGMAEIEDDDYIQTLEALVQKKSDAIHEPDLFKKRNKVASYAMYKGFESDLVWDVVKRLID